MAEEYVPGEPTDAELDFISSFCHYDPDRPETLRFPTPPPVRPDEYKNWGKEMTDAEKTQWELDLITKTIRRTRFGRLAADQTYNEKIIWHKPDPTEMEAQKAEDMEIESLKSKLRKEQLKADENARAAIAARSGSGSAKEDSIVIQLTNKQIKFSIKNEPENKMNNKGRMSIASFWGGEEQDDEKKPEFVVKSSDFPPL